MKLTRLLPLAFASVVSSTILQNGQIRPNDYPNTALSSVGLEHNSSWHSYGPNAHQISYKGRWDDKHISWWTAPGLKFGFTGEQVAISFGNWTSPGVLIAYRIDGLDWQLTNVTANSTHLLANAQSESFQSSGMQTFEMRVTNWNYGIQIHGVHVLNGRLLRIKNAPRTMELIGDSLSAGQYATLEGIASYSWGLMYGLGNTEFSITAYPGICLYDGEHNDGYCYGGGQLQRGQTFRWLKTADNSPRSVELYGSNPPDWDFAAHPAADITIINLGANDSGNKVSPEKFYKSYLQLINDIRSRWPDTQIIVLNLWSLTNPFPVNNTYTTTSPLESTIERVVRHFNHGPLNEKGGEGFVHFFNTTGILQHNDIGPLGHPTDFGDVKLASHLMQYIKLVFGWTFEQVGPEVQHETTYWNDESGY